MAIYVIHNINQGKDCGIILPKAKLIII